MSNIDHLKGYDVPKNTLNIKLNKVEDKRTFNTYNTTNNTTNTTNNTRRGGLIYFLYQVILLPFKLIHFIFKLLYREIWVRFDFKHKLETDRAKKKFQKVINRVNKSRDYSEEIY